MNIVYKIIFVNRLKHNIKPYYYIGSKSKCSIIDGNIIDYNGNIYRGSSKYKNYRSIVENEEIEIEVLFQSGHIKYKDLLIIEKEYHLLCDVVASSEYFNLSIATVNNYSDPSYATYKHVETGKCVRLNRDHPLVLNGTYVGATMGYKHTEEAKSKISINNSGCKNAFYGKKHSEKTRAKISKKIRGKKHSEESRLKMSKSRKGKCKSEEHKAKIGRKGYIMLKNMITLECIRVLKVDKDMYDPSIWINPTKLKNMMGEYKGTSHSEETKAKIGRKGYIMLKNINTSEVIRVLKLDKDNYDPTIWMHPQTVKKILKGSK